MTGIKVNFKDGKTLTQEIEEEIQAEEFFTKMDSFYKTVRYILSQQPDSFLKTAKRNGGKHIKPGSKEFKEMIEKVKEQKKAGLSDLQVSTRLGRTKGYVGYLRKKGYLAEAE